MTLHKASAVQYVGGQGGNGRTGTAVAPTTGILLPYSHRRRQIFYLVSYPPITHAQGKRPETNCL